MSKRTTGKLDDLAKESMSDESYEVCTNDKAFEVDTHCNSKREARVRRQELMDAGYNAYVRKRSNGRMVA